MRLLRRLFRFPTRSPSWPPAAAHVLIGLHVGIFVAQFLIGPTLENNPLVAWGALSADALRAGQVWRLVTHTFLHGGPLALLGETLLLYFAGRNLEAIVGRWHFLGIYFLGGTLAGLLRAGGAFLVGGAAAAAPVLGGRGAALAELLAFTTIMPELEIGALIFLPVPMMRVKAKYVAAGAVALPLLFIGIECFPAVGDTTGSARLAWVGALLGGCIGWLYARGLGFGQRWWPARPAAAASSARPPARPPKSVAMATGAAAAGGGGELSASGNNNNNAGAAAAMKQEAKAAAAAPLFTEREQAMSAREYISVMVDPILEKIGREGLASLSDPERRILEIAREKMAASRPPG